MGCTGSRVVPTQEADADVDEVVRKPASKTSSLPILRSDARNSPSRADSPKRSHRPSIDKSSSDSLMLSSRRSSRANMSPQLVNGSPPLQHMSHLRHSEQDSPFSYFRKRKPFREVTDGRASPAVLGGSASGADSHGSPRKPSAAVIASMSVSEDLQNRPRSSTDPTAGLSSERTSATEGISPSRSPSGPTDILRRNRLNRSGSLVKFATAQQTLEFNIQDSPAALAAQRQGTPTSLARASPPPPPPVLRHGGASPSSSSSSSVCSDASAGWVPFSSSSSSSSSSPSSSLSSSPLSSSSSSSLSAGPASSPSQCSSAAAGAGPHPSLVVMPVASSPVSCAASSMLPIGQPLPSGRSILFPNEESAEDLADLSSTSPSLPSTPAAVES